MPTASWPSDLPRPNASAYSIEPVDASIRTEMDEGAARVRRRTFARNDNIPLGWTLTDAQLATFRAWFDSSTGAAGGSAWFTTNLPLGTGGYVNCEARFIGKYKAPYSSYDSWIVNATLEIR